MITFPHCVQLSDLEDLSMPGWFMLTKPFDAIEDGVLYRAPAGMLTDGASIPRFAWRIVGSPWTGRYLRAAIIHDAGYNGKLLSGPVDGILESCEMTRKEIDELFYRLMLARGVGKRRAWAMHRAVRAGGWAPWNRSRRGTQDASA